MQTVSTIILFQRLKAVHKMEDSPKDVFKIFQLRMMGKNVRKICRCYTIPSKCLLFKKASTALMIKNFMWVPEGMHERMKKLINLRIFKKRTLLKHEFSCSVPTVKHSSTVFFTIRRFTSHVLLKMC